jgi:hypothetical protein
VCQQGHQTCYGGIHYIRGGGEEVLVPLRRRQRNRHSHRIHTGCTWPLGLTVVVSSVGVLSSVCIHRLNLCLIIVGII